MRSGSNPALGARQQFIKRLLDVTLTLALAPLVLPVCVLAAIPILIEARTSPFFRQIRVGRDGRLFTIVKLRTMHPCTPEGPSHEIGTAGLLTSGRFYRRLKIDELPQLWNVLIGTMSLVGPRPHLPGQMALDEERRKWGVLAIKPGITGVSQVAGLDMSDPIRLAASDATYLGGWSLARDLKILWQTLVGRGNGDAATAPRGTA